MSKLKKVLLIGLPVLIVLAATVFFIVRSSQNNKTFTITFDSNGGSEVETQEVKLNDKVEEPEEPTKEGYKFKGWYLSGKKYDFDKKVIKDIKLKARWTKIAVEEVVIPPVVIYPTPVVNKKDATIKLETPEVFYVNRETNFGLTITANDYKDTMVVGKATISEPEALEKLEYKGADGLWYELSLDEPFGGKTGFVLVDGTNEFRATFNKVGEYEVTVQLLNVTDNKVMAEATSKIVVEKKAAELTFEAEEPFYLNKATDFAISVVANDDAGTKVIGKATVLDVEALEKLEYKGADDNWYELSLEDDFGESEGFALADGASEFKATFNKEGVYEVAVQLLNVEDGSVVAEVKTTITVERKAAELTFEAEKPFYIDQATDFVISVVANNDEGTKVIGKATISDAEALEKLEYKGADDNWYELSLEDDFGQTEGFALADGASEFKATFNKEGVYEVTVQLLNVEDGSVVTETTTTIAVELEPAKVTFELPEEFVVGKTAEFTVSTIANDYKDLMVVGTGGLSNPEAIEKLEYYEVQDGNWYELPANTDFGSAAGFPLQDATSKFRVTFKTVGEYEVSFQILNADTRELVAEAETEITVREFIEPAINFVAEDEFVVGETVEFTISTEANDLEGLMVLGTGELSNPEAIEKLEYYETAEGMEGWYELPADTEFGPAAGFPLQDATSKFRVTFKTAGTYTVDYAVIDAETQETVAQSQTTITVVDATQPQA